MSDPVTIANDIRDEQLRRGVAIDQHGQALADGASGIMAELEPELVGRLGTLLQRMRMRGPSSSVLGSATFGKAQDLINGLVTATINDIAGELEASMRALAKTETAATAKMLGAALGVKLALPDQRQSGADAVSWPIGDRTAREWLNAAGDVLAGRLKGELQGALARGTDDAGILAAVKKAIQDAIPKVAGVAKSAARNVSNRAGQRVVDANPDDFRGVMWVAMLETNTCVRCWGLHGRTFKPDVGPRPPLHPSCACVAIPLVKGQPDPDVMDADDWLAEQTTEFQDEALGPARAKLWRSGAVGSVRDLSNRRARALTLAELNRRLGA